MIFSILNYDLSLGKLIGLLLLVVFAFMLSLVFRSFAQGFVAYKCGDITPKATGRLTMNPMAHLDPWGFICLILCGVGWSKPMPINPSNFKKYRSGIAWTSISGVLANLLLCVVGSLFYVLSLKWWGNSLNILTIALLYFTYTNALLAIFHLIPVYPLDGFNFVSSFMKSDSKFVQGNIKYGAKIVLWVLVIDIFMDLFLDVSIVSFILDWLANLICSPLINLWGWMFL